MTDTLRPPAGLCATCQHAKRTATRRGSVFYLCLLSQSDASFRKYPPLPVVHCRGYAEAVSTGDYLSGALDETDEGDATRSSVE